MTGPTFTPDLTVPNAAPSKPAKRRRWPWVVALIAALLAGVGIGAAGASDPTGERTKAVEAREQTVAKQEQDLQARKDSETTALDSRKSQLDKQSADIARRERELLPKEQAAAKNTIKGDGIFLVGKDINPGTYRNSGTSSCYWQRSSGTSGDFDEILANGNENGPAVVTIQPGDVAFTSKRCGTWTLVS
ncbi:hypothetical protein AB4Z09_13925 [Rhodococcus sp. TAF43]|uniref:hypothetical protein n=1 Tax=Rhodococcus sp. TAF43 TaxID=3237483 RepID=UPI003F97AD74